MFLVPVLILGLFGCTDGQDSDWFLFNSPDDKIEVRVTASPDLGDAVSIDLHSSLGAVVIGSAILTPGSGPVGTEHELLVEVADTWQEDVGRVTLSADSGDRGQEVFPLRQDTADHGMWLLVLTSSGAEGEARVDEFTVQLFQEQLVEEPIDTSTEQ